MLQEIQDELDELQVSERLLAAPPLLPSHFLQGSSKHVKPRSPASGVVRVRVNDDERLQRECRRQPVVRHAS